MSNKVRTRTPFQLPRQVNADEVSNLAYIFIIIDFTVLSHESGNLKADEDNKDNFADDYCTVFEFIKGQTYSSCDICKVYDKAKLEKQK
jgi:hypothetical protein